MDRCREDTAAGSARATRPAAVVGVRDRDVAGLALGLRRNGQRQHRETREHPDRPFPHPAPPRRRFNPWYTTGRPAVPCRSLCSMSDARALAGRYWDELLELEPILA